MSGAEIYIEAIRKALGLPEDFNISRQTKIADVPGWDSFGWVAVIQELEAISGKDFPFEDIENIATLDQLINKCTN